MVNRSSFFAACSKIVTLLERTDRRRSGLLRVLTYHRVDEPEAHPELYPGLISATPTVFDVQMRHLAAHYHVLSLQQVLELCQTGSPFPSRAVLVTFDDAYQDFAQHAWPTMKRYRLPATLFVPTAYPDHPEHAFWWDRVHHAVNMTRRKGDLDTPLGPLAVGTLDQRRQAFKRLRDYIKRLPHTEAMPLVEQLCDRLGVPPIRNTVLNWEALRRLAREGVTLGAHTRTHPLMNRVSLEEVRAEAEGSRADLEREIGSTAPIFAYPSGGFNAAVVRTLRDAGFALAFTTVPGINDMHRADRLRLRRINVGRRAPLPLFQARLLPWTIYFNRWRPLSGT
jgi:peptidoglycan/xylan/chitin deacetylase (PgdA/CDA1 family)